MSSRSEAPRTATQAAPQADQTDALPELLKTSFYDRPADLVAPELLGKILAVRSGDGAATRLARIVETEAYVGEKDLACHASKGLTARTSTIFGPPGHAYVYLIYGVYDMFNVVTEREGVPHAVLVRAVELLADTDRTDGPGKLTRALGISRARHNGLPLDRPPLSIHAGSAVAKVGISARVGVAYAGAWADAPLRFFDEASSAVSRPGPRQLGSGGRPD